MSQQQQRQGHTAIQNQSKQAPQPQTEVATGQLEEMTADLEKIKKSDQLLKMAIAGMSQMPALSGGEKSARVLIENIKQEPGE